MKIAIFGTGYVGLVTGACFAEIGHQVHCIDNDAGKIEGLENGVMPISEPGLDKLVARNFKAGRLVFSTDAKAGTNFADLIFIAVGTPPEEDGSADLRHVLSVARTIGDNLESYKVVVDKSTVPVGTADKVAAQISACLAARKVEIPFDVCSNPEFLKEGSAIEDFTKAARIIVGTDSERARQMMRECYAPYSRNHDKLMFMDARSAELTKYAANAMLATKISFMNEMANLAEELGADIEEVRKGIGSDPRIGYHFIYPGLGYGGSCFPKDVRALIKTAEGVKFDARLLRAVEERNNEQKSVLFQKVERRFKGDLKGRTFALWGLAFKPNTDDMREAPSRPLMEALWKAGAKVQAYDPEAMQECQTIYGLRDDLMLCGTKEAALRGADALLIATEWKSFGAPSFDAMKEALTSPLIFDGRNLYDPKVVARHGFEYHSIGRQPARD